MLRFIGILVMAALFAAGTWKMWPLAYHAAGLLYIQHDPVRLADQAVRERLSAPVARTEIENALAAGDVELATSFLELAREHGIEVDPALVARVDSANSTGAQTLRAAWSFGRGLVTGTPDDMASLAGTATGDLFVFGDIRDAARESYHLARGEEADELVLGLACAGLAVTAGTYATFGAGAPVRVGLSLVKGARRAGRLAAPLAARMGRMASEAIDLKAFAAAMGRAAFVPPATAVHMARDAVKVERLEGMMTLAKDAGRVERAGGARAALEGLAIAEEPRDLARIARVAEAKGGKTRAILKLAGRAAYKLTVAAIELARWVFGILLTVLGFCSRVKRATEHATLGYLGWRKARRARAAAALAMAAVPA